jgi:hypothetical protein
MTTDNHTGCIRFFFDAGSNVCLWACDDATKARHGYTIDANDLPLSTNTRHWLHHLMAWYDTSLDWDNPGGASPWSDDEKARFQLAAQAGLARLRQELTPAGYEVCDESCTAQVNYPPMELLARIFMPAADAAEAAAHNQALHAALAAYSPRPINPPEPYWKIPGWYEHFFQLNPATPASFDALIALSEGDWDVTRSDDIDKNHPGECDAVWSPSPGHIFLVPEVTWAHILLIYPNPPTPDQEYLPL